MNRGLLLSIFFVGTAIALSIAFSFWIYMIVGGVVTLVLILMVTYIEDEYGGGSSAGRTRPAQRRQSGYDIGRLREKVRREFERADTGDDMR